jgi:hypothetical protein
MVDGGVIASISATENRAGTRLRRAKFTESNYNSVVCTNSTLCRWIAR